MIKHQTKNTVHQVLTAFLYSSKCNAWKMGTPHFHKNYEILMPVVETVRVWVEDTEYLLAPGDAIIIHPFQVHGFYIPHESYVWCSVFSAHLINTLHGLLMGKKPKSPIFHPSESVKAFFLDRMMSTFGKQFEVSSLTSDQALVAKSCLYAIGREYLQQVELIPTTAGEKTENLAVAVTRYIADNFQLPITLKDMAKELGYNYQYLSNAFHDLLGLNFKTLLNQYRMEHAVVLLTQTRLPIVQVAFESGFQSLRTFNRVCFDFFHQTPSEIRINKPI